MTCGHSCDNHVFIGHFSPDAKRVFREIYEKFEAGAMEHGPLDLRKLDPLQEGTKELIDWNSYLAMATVQLRDLLDLMAKARM